MIFKQFSNSRPQFQANFGSRMETILHYSISKQLWDHSFGKSENADISAKEKLLKWLRARLLAKLPASNFTSSRNDKMRLGCREN